jgi:hypothetical protein
MKEMTIRIVKNEKGSILVIALLMIALLTLLGMSSTTTSVIEVQIAANEQSYKENFFKAEAAALEAAQRLENETDSQTLTNKTPVWLHDSDIMGYPSNWDYNDQDDNDNAETAGTSIDPNGQTYFSVVDRGVAPGSSLSMSGGTNLYEHAVYGFSSADSGQQLIEIGYRKRY